MGLMGVGKTTIGRLLAKKTGRLFYDSDHEIEQRTGVDISLIFEIEGESGFRKREAKILAELVQLNNIVLSTGGGSIITPQNRENLQDNGRIIYLKATSEKLYKRTKHDKKRPLLDNENRLTKIETLLVAREPLYNSLANIVIETDNLTIKQILGKILHLI